MTKKEILFQMNGSPLMESLRRGTTTELTRLQNNLREQIQVRKFAQFHSYARTFIGALMGGTIGALLTQPTLIQGVMAYTLAILACSIYWWLTAGEKFRNAKATEKILMTLVSTALAERLALATAEMPTS